MKALGPPPKALLDTWTLAAGANNKDGASSNIESPPPREKAGRHNRSVGDASYYLAVEESLSNWESVNRGCYVTDFTCNAVDNGARVLRISRAMYLRALKASVLNVPYLVGSQPEESSSSGNGSALPGSTASSTPLKGGSVVVAEAPSSGLAVGPTPCLDSASSSERDPLVSKIGVGGGGGAGGGGIHHRDNVTGASSRRMLVSTAAPGSSRTSSTQSPMKMGDSDCGSNLPPKSRSDSSKAAYSLLSAEQEFNSKDVLISMINSSPSIVGSVRLDR